MIYRLVSFVIQLLILITILTFIFTNPFIISIDISDYKYSFSSNIFFRSFTYVLITYLPNYIYIFLNQDFLLINCSLKINIKD